MKTRPALKPGDVCKLHKKYRHRVRRFPFRNYDITYIVQSVLDGNGIDGDSSISALLIQKGQYYKHGVLFQKARIYRRKLWFTGHNINDKNASPVPQASWYNCVASTTPAQKKPKANEEQCVCGRMKDRGKACWWCGAVNPSPTEYTNCFCGAAKVKGEPCPSCGH